MFPTNARASGFGLCQAAGRVGAFVAIPSFLWIQQGFGLTAVFVVIAVIVAITTFSVGRSPVGGGNRGHVEMAVSLMSTRLLDVTVQAQAGF